ncbi:MAG: hypothetical protein MUF84_00160 [Anaerolineae bacterium]|nr:hypothetical protein [Anaerolineae bacterium]
MAIKERNQQMRVVAELLTVHVPEQLGQDPDLARDLLSVAGTALHEIYEDAEQSAKAWDKRAYHSKADELRRDWDWAAGASNYALGLALRPQPLGQIDVDKLVRLIRPGIEKPARRQISDPVRFRGAARIVKRQQTERRKPLRE